MPRSESLRDSSRLRPLARTIAWCRCASIGGICQRLRHFVRVLYVVHPRHVIGVDWFDFFDFFDGKGAHQARIEIKRCAVLGAHFKSPVIGHCGPPRIKHAFHGRVSHYSTRQTLVHVYLVAAVGAHKFGPLHSPCWGRIKKMEEAGVIEGYTVRINPQALDLADAVLVQVTLDSHSDNTLEKFGETLASIPEVIEAHLVSGDYDYLLRVVVKDTRDYERLLREKLYKIKGIRHSRSSFVLRTLKKADLPLNIS